ncbi:MAG: diacylglycerol kinase family protein [Candidatus Promineifilaceae bacterium]
MNAPADFNPSAGAQPSFLRFRRSFGFAFEGLAFLWRTQPNGRVHAAISLLVILLALWLRLVARDWAVLVLAMMAVWMAELSNTALEALVDLASPEFRPMAKAAKDLAAAAVLIGAIGAAAVGLLLLGPALWLRLTAG